jgi:hypothetical protein
MPLSFRIDMLGVVAARKPAVRTRLLGEPCDVLKLRQGIEALGFTCVSDDAYVVVAATSQYAADVLAVDRRAGPHEYELGVLLGYPPCCARAAATTGERNLDDAAATTVAAGSGSDPSISARLDVSSYVRGLALVSHIPCSATCRPSLRLAAAAVAYVRSAPGEVLEECPVPEPWATWEAAVTHLDGLPPLRRSATDRHRPS